MIAPSDRAPLARDRDVLLSGVSAGLARHLGARPTSVRLVLGGLTLAGGFGLVLYAWLWAFVPVTAGPTARSRRLPVSAILLGLAVLASVAIPLTAGRALPIGVIESSVLALAALAAALGWDPRDTRHAGAAPTVALLASTALVVEGLALVPLGFLAGRPAVAVVAVADIVVGLAGFLAPRALAFVRRRAGERATLAREEQRAEIAAHLHDSVLQTLALIQSRAGAGTEVARIARAQERELRDWLFAGTDPFAGDLATELRGMATELEIQHPVRIEIVTVGDVGEVESHALVAAAREALTNAARHVGGDVTVYAEATPEAIDVFVRDRGAGFDTAAIPAGRLGIRESILGRMARAGGSAAVTSDASGTEVQLRLPRDSREVSS